MRLFRYCTSEAHARTWIEGGNLPLKAASFYRSHEREATRTPDEVVHRKLTGLSGGQFESRFKMHPQSRGSLVVKNLRVGEEPLLRDIEWHQEQRDGLILCLSTEASQSIAVRLGKNHCIEVIDIASLIASLDAQLGVKANHGPCAYTSEYDRNTFLKSNLDAWQMEYRLYWELTSESTVIISPGTGKMIEL